MLAAIATVKFRQLKKMVEAWMFGEFLKSLDKIGQTLTFVYKFWDLLQMNLILKWYKNKRMADF